MTAPGSIDFSKYHPDQSQIKRVHLERFSYKKVFQQLEIDIPEITPSGAKYAKAIVYLTENKLLPVFDDKAAIIRKLYDLKMDQFGLNSSLWGQDNSWINWDLAKQLYCYLDKNSTGEILGSPQYRIANPLTDEIIVGEIVCRHIGWEHWSARKHLPVVSDHRRIIEMFEGNNV